jgi:glycosyltransferase involved in cell wall biosynthesis
MLISVFTPSHDLRWIGDAYDSLRKQSLKSWEWVVVPNGDAARGDAGALSARIRKDPKVRIIAAPQFADNGKVGALKRFAASQCKGEVLVELDHDDMLAPQALDRIVRAVETDAGEPDACLVGPEPRPGLDPRRL